MKFFSEEEQKTIIQQKYSVIAKKGCCANSGCNSKQWTNEKISESIGYSKEQIEQLSEANLGLGCGNPLALLDVKEGSTLVDLGSGAGFDACIAAKKLGPKGKVIGIDITPEMIEKARKNILKVGLTNVEFKLADIENIPLEDNSIDYVISNCVINLAPSKEKVFTEIFRILKPEGKMCISDIVLLKELTLEQRKDEELLSGCVAGAILKEEYLTVIRKMGFKIEKIVEDPNISKRQYQGIALESIKIIAKKS
jgi:SAM-dependent methyltransferase